MDDFKIEHILTLDDLDIVLSLLEAYQENMSKDDEDKKAVDHLVESLYDFTDRISARSEYTTGVEWPENLELHLTCSDEDIKKSSD